MKHPRLHITILIFILVTNFTYGQTDKNSKKHRKKNKVENYSTPILDKLLTSNDTIHVKISIEKILTCTESENEIIDFVKIMDKYYGYYRDDNGHVFRLDSINIQTIQEIIDLEKKCLDTDWDCFGGFDGRVTTYVTIDFNDNKSKFKYCNKEIDGLDIITDKLTNKTK